MTVTNETPLEENRGSSSLPDWWSKEAKRKFYQRLGRNTLNDLSRGQKFKIFKIDPFLLHILRELVK